MQMAIEQVRSMLRLPERVAGVVPTAPLLAGLLALGAAAAGITVVRAATKRVPTRYAPGPPGLPILGNALELPTENDFLVYTSWAKKWGDLMRLTVLGQPIYIISSYKIATDLLEKRSLIYSDRPIMRFAQELVGWKRTLVLTSTRNPRFRRYRKLFHNALNKDRVRDFIPIQEKSMAGMLLMVLRKPDDFRQHIQYVMGATITKIAYDYDMALENDPFVKLAESSADNFSKASQPGQWMVDMIPILQYVPAWFPGAGFKRQAAEWKKVNDYLHTKPFNDVVEKMKAGTAGDSVLRGLLTPEEGSVIDGDAEDVIKWVVGAVYSGGADTTVCALSTFVLAMVLYPEAQATAQAEIDRVVGTDRLPGISDRPALHYVDALYKETLRWHPVAPLAVPHRVTKEDEYAGYTIPAGATVVANIWAMSRAQPDADLFRPERHLPGGNHAGQDPRTYVFGFGRRVCPGLNLADSEVWLGVVSLLAAFKIAKKSDGNGGFITPSEDYEQGIISHPKPFVCDIKPRLANSAQLIHAAAAIHH